MSSDNLHEIYIFLRNLLVTAAIIVPVILIFWKLERHERKQAQPASYALPESYRQQLTDTNNFQEVPAFVRVLHCCKTLIYGFVIYLLTMLLGTICLSVQGQFTSFSDLLISSSPILAVIIFFTLISWFKVGPWYKVYRTTAYISNPSGLDHLMRYVVFYDYKNQEYSTGRVHMYELLLLNAHKNCDIVDIIVYKTPKKMKVAGAYHKNIFVE